MNLLTDPWMPAIRRDGTREKVAIWQLLDEYETNPIVDIRAPRPDFRSAIYQLLIGIVQVAAAPEDEEVWLDRWEEPYSPEDFKERLLQYADCFEIDSEGPAFMQDYDLNSVDTKLESLTNLFISLPANEHYAKVPPKRISPYWAAVALYTLQTFAPSGGRGHRVGLRGGGPLTTILLPGYEDDILKPSLWKKTWLNILTEEHASTMSGNINLLERSDIFPWMKITKVSEKKGTELLPGECHPYHMYFGMPRRIRFIIVQESGNCDLTNEPCQEMVTGYHTRHSGNNYDGVWQHPLNAYAVPKKADELPISIKPQPGGINYRHWLGIACPKETHMPANVIAVTISSTERREVLRRNPAMLWASGYDMDNMKARCWYESTMPVYGLDSDSADKIADQVSIFIHQASELTFALRSAIKEAWFSRPKDAKGDVSFVMESFWRRTETDFYRLLDRLIGNLDDDYIWAECTAQWRDLICGEVLSLFDQWALAQQEDGLDMHRVVKARNVLEWKIGKVRKEFNNLIEVE